MDLFSHSPALLALPISSFMLGVLGSPHCLGMCGAISFLCSKKRAHSYLYHSGRLGGYLLFGLLASYIGGSFKNHFFGNTSSYLYIALGVLIFLSGAFYRQLRSRKTSMLFSRIRTSVFAKAIDRGGSFAAFVMGFFSFTLPCGLLYGILVPIVLANTFVICLVSIIAFWLGTLPVMVSIARILNLNLYGWLKSRPLVISMILVLVGSSTIIFHTNKILSYDPQASNPLLCQ